MIEVRGLSKLYGEKVGAMGIDFTVQKGEIVGLLGPNGSGKSTIMRIMTGCMPPSAGTVLVDGFDLLKQPREVTRRIGFLPEIPPLYPEMRVREYLSFVAAIRGVRKAERPRRVDETMEKVSIPHVRDRLIRNLSKGYRQRVGLAQAIIANPPILVLDEPTVGLDPKQMNEVRQLITELGRDHTIILSSHILPEVSMVCRRVIILNRGRIIAEDTTDSLARGGADTGRFILTVQGSAGDAAAVLAGIGGITCVTPMDNPSTGPADQCTFLVESAKGAAVRVPLFHALAAKAIPIIELRTIGATLEEVFLQLTGACEDGESPS
ncbi:MAG: ABC transporter ATP-binding protein [Spirochaetia bacterium]